MATSFFGGEHFGGEFFNTGSTPPVVAAGPTPAGGGTAKRKRKVIIGEKVYEVESLRDVEFLLKRVVRDEVEPVESIAKSAKARIRVVDRMAAKLDKVEPVALPMAEVDWSSLWVQLAMQERAYAEILERVIARQEEDDIETLLLLH